MFDPNCLVLSIALLGAIAPTTAKFYTSVVPTANGPVRGEVFLTVRQSLEYASFKGIPYAEAPVGSRRFRPPVAKAVWPDVLDATRDGHVCMQYLEGNSSVVGSEDCLNINVYTPHTDFTNFASTGYKAVMVWIYGGAFTAGYSKSSVYGPDFLLEQDVIVVSLNYRLGPFGFLNINHDHANGNVGLKDQNLALKWVRRNIAYFGGDPNRVTIFGQSAGAVSVDLHVLSDMSRGLFSRSISMSGSSLCLYWGIQTHTEAKLRAFALGSSLGIKAKSKDDLLRALYEVPASEIVLKAHKMRLLPFRPTIEKTYIAVNEEKFLSKCSIDKYLAGNYNKGPHMMGFTSVEAKSFMEPSIIQPDYLKNITSRLSSKTIRKLSDYASDVLFVTGIDSKQRLLYQRNGHPIFYYRFSFDPNNTCDPQYCDIGRVGHVEDIPYLFYSPPIKKYTGELTEQLTIERYVRLFSNFAKYGNPTPYGIHDPVIGLTWPDSGPLGLHLEISSNLSIGYRPISRLVKAYESAGLGTSRAMNDCFSKR